MIDLIAIDTMLSWSQSSSGFEKKKLNTEVLHLVQGFLVGDVVVFWTGRPHRHPPIYQTETEQSFSGFKKKSESINNEQLDNITSDDGNASDVIETLLHAPNELPVNESYFFIEPQIEL